MIQAVIYRAAPLYKPKHRKEIERKAIVLIEPTMADVEKWVDEYDHNPDTAYLPIREIVMFDRSEWERDPMAAKPIKSIVRQVSGQ